MDPWSDAPDKHNMCSGCHKLIENRETFVYYEERLPTGERTGKMLFFHSTASKKCYKQGLEFRMLEKNPDSPKMKEGKLIPEDFDEW